MVQIFLPSLTIFQFGLKRILQYRILIYLASMLKIFSLKDLQTHSVHHTACFFPRRTEAREKDILRPSTENRLKDESLKYFPKGMHTS